MYVVTIHLVPWFPYYVLSIVICFQYCMIWIQFSDFHAAFQIYFPDFHFTYYVQNTLISVLFSKYSSTRHPFNFPHKFQHYSSIVNVDFFSICPKAGSIFFLRSALPRKNSKNRENSRIRPRVVTLLAAMHHVTRWYASRGPRGGGARSPLLLYGQYWTGLCSALL